MLVLRPGALGDTLLAVPALRALRARYGERLILAAQGETARLLASLGEVDEGWAFDDPRLAWLFNRALHAPRERVVAWLDAASVPGLRDPLAIAPSRPPTMDVHCADHLLRSIGATDLDGRPLRVRPHPSRDVLVHPGSGAAAKNWPAERFAHVVELVGLDRVRLIVGEADATAATSVEQRVGRRLRRFEGLTLAELAARLAGCRAYLGNDSGVSHLAGLCGATTYVLFGPTPSLVWRPLGPHVQVLDFGVAPEAVARRLATV